MSDWRDNVRVKRVDGAYQCDCIVGTVQYGVNATTPEKGYAELEKEILENGSSVEDVVSIDDFLNATLRNAGVRIKMTTTDNAVRRLDNEWPMN